MNVLAALQAARAAVAANPSRPATAILHDSPGARLVVFRIGPGQFVPPHRSASTVTIHVLAGSGHLSGEHAGEEVAQQVTAGDVALYAPSELHGMRADGEELLLLATISPRPGGA
jgi:quercetin dioxygenase-like cupin family protein